MAKGVEWAFEIPIRDDRSGQGAGKEIGLRQTDHYAQPGVSRTQRGNECQEGPATYARFGCAAEPKSGAV